MAELKKFEKSLPEDFEGFATVTPTPKTTRSPALEKMYKETKEVKRETQAPSACACVVRPSTKEENKEQTFFPGEDISA